MLYAYCVRFAGEPGPAEGLSGIDGATVELREAEGLGLWLSPGAAGAATVERLRAHDRVVRAALRTATPLPIRFGTTFADAGHAAEALREGGGRFGAALRRVAGRVEMGVRVSWSPSGEPEAGPVADAAWGPGRTYLEARRRLRSAEEDLRARAEAVLEGVAGRFADMDLETVRRLLPEPGIAGTLAHLVHRRNLREYRERMRQVQNDPLPIRVLPSGPWAPYSFVESS